ncbi:MAG: alpha/beta fold hydrolase [Betaproteobacteria bacterium]
MAVSDSTAPESGLGKWSRRAGLTLAAGAALGYGGIAGFVYLKQESLIFRPAPLAADHRFSIPGVEEVTVPVAGATLSALHLRLPNPTGIVFFLHGNAGNLQTWMTNVDFYRRVNYDLFMLDYRGFGKSTGQVEGEQQLHDDVRAAWNTIASQYAGKKIAIYGRSLGTGLAAKLAGDIQPDLTILVSPYSSLQAMGDEQYPWLPAFINRYPMRSDQWLGAIRRPVMIVHGDRDTLIPISHGERLKKLRAATEMMVITGAGHNDIHKFPAYLDGLAERLRKL